MEGTAEFPPSASSKLAPFESSAQVDFLRQAIFKRVFTPSVFILNSRVLEVDAVAEEMRLSMFLLFLRTDESQRIAQKLFSKIFHANSTRFAFWRDNPAARTLPDMREDMRQNPWDQADYKPGRDFKMKGAFHLRQFRYYRPRLAYLQEQMKAWRPRRFSELFKPGYYDRFTWFIAIFGLVFGIIATLSLVISIIQVIFAVLTWQATK